MQKFGTFLSLMLISLTALFVLTSHHAAAAPEYCFMLGDPSNGSTAANACLAGQTAEPELQGLSSGMSSSALQNTFMNDVKTYANKPYPVDKTGVAYIVAQLQQQGGNWETNLSLTTLTVENIPAAAGCANTAYDPTSNSVVHISDCQHDAALVARQNGNIVFAIRINCGNVLGNFPGPSPDSPPTGSLSLSCNTNGTGLIKLTFSDPNGSTSAKLTVTYAGGSGASFNYTSGSYTRTITAIQANGSWKASLVVQDAGGSQDKTFNAAAGTCNKVPTGAFGAASCNGDTDTYTITATFNDSNGPTSARVMGNNGTIYGAAKSGTSATWSISTNSMPRAGFPAKLQVNDYVGGATNTWDTVSTLPIPNCPPKGNIAGTSCTSVQLKLWDPNAPSSNAQYYLSLNGGAQQGPFTYNGGQNGSAITQDISHVSGFDYWVRNQVTLYGVDVDAGNSHISVQSTTLPTICDSLSCGTTNLPASDIVAGQSYTFHVTDNINGPGAVGPRGGQFSSIRVGSLSTSRGYTPASGSLVLQNASPDPVFTPTSAGTYTLTWAFSGGEAPTTSCNKSVQVGYSPFFTVEGGDIAAGPGFGSTCSTNTSAGITASNLGNQSGIGYFGAGSTLGAFASGSITQFVTDSTNDPGSDRSFSTNGGAIGSATGLPSGLAFGNANAAGSTYGGNFNRPDWCAPDYEAAADTGSSLPIFNPGNLTSGTYRLSGSTVPALVIPQGVHITLVATGNVFLSGDITYDTSYSVTSADASRVPQFSLLVKGGDVYIANTIGTLTGFYDTQPNGSGTGGTLYTCASGPGVAYSNDYASCNHALTIYGAVAAAKLHLGRTWGNLVSAGGVDNSPSERIVYSPELWLGDMTGPVCQDDTTSTGCLYQAYTALPPIL